MQRFWLIAGVAAAIIGLLWLAEDSGLQKRLVEFGPQEVATDRPSWGDVANKVGEFAREEQDLKATIGTARE